MFDDLRDDFARYSTMKGNLILYFLKAIHHAGFRAMVLYRIGRWFRKRNINILAALSERIMHHASHCWICTTAEIGGGLYIAHVCGLVIGGVTVIGKNCDVRHNVTLGGNFFKSDSEGRRFPVLGDNISLGTGAVVTGPVKIGDNSIIGANSVVNRDIPANMIAAGNPAKVIRERWPEESGRKLEEKED